jgi:hypothetical protein
MGAGSERPLFSLKSEIMSHEGGESRLQGRKTLASLSGWQAARTAAL